MALFHYQDLKIIDLTLIIPRYLKKKLSGGAQSSSPLNPLKIQHFNWFCKFCFYKGLDMYKKG